MADFIVYVVATVITPGPNTIMSMRNGARCGFVRGMRFNLGIYTGFTILMFLCLLFSKTVYRLVPQIRPVMIALGAAYMLYQAYRCYTGGSLSDAEAERGSFLEGLLLQFVNAKAAIFGVTALSNYVVSFYPGIAVQAAFCVLLSTIAFLCGLLWSAFGAGFSKLFARHGKAVNTVMALLLVYCAGKLLMG